MAVNAMGDETEGSIRWQLPFRQSDVGGKEVVGKLNDAETLRHRYGGQRDNEVARQGDGASVTFADDIIQHPQDVVALHILNGRLVQCENIYVVRLQPPQALHCAGFYE